MDSNDSSRKLLRVLGLSYREIQQGAYALILAEVDGSSYIPIVIGTPEAQAIAMRLENITPPRPVAHDLFASFAHAFGIRLKEVFIHKFEDGIFSSELIFEDKDGNEVTLDARTSDAIAIAIRTRSPIYTTPEIINETGFVMEATQREPENDGIEEVSLEDISRDPVGNGEPLEDLSSDQLETMLSDLIAEERYEEAARINLVLKRKRNEQ